MNDFAQHYSLLLGLNEDWLIKHVDLDIARQQVEIQLEHNTQCKPCSPQCGLPRPLKNHADERIWRHLDTMQSQTTIVARIPRTNCPDCGVRNVHLPWAAPHGRFTLLFSKSRRLSKDYEILEQSSKVFVYLTMVSQMLKRFY